MDICSPLPLSKNCGGTCPLYPPWNEGGDRGYGHKIKRPIKFLVLIRATNLIGRSIW